MDKPRQPWVPMAPTQSQIRSAIIYTENRISDTEDPGMKAYFNRRRDNLLKELLALQLMEFKR